MSAPQFKLFDPNSPEGQALLRPRAILLSASVPRDKDDLIGQERLDNLAFVNSAKPTQIREAVVYFCRFAFQNDLNIIFGAHPEISPMVLEAALRFASRSTHKRVLIFQSAWFANDRLVKATLDLADWSGGELLWTAPSTTRAESLTTMRQTMVAAPGLVGAVFIGGMSGVIDESQLFSQAQWNKPRFAIGSTGSAAAKLLRDEPDQHSGPHATASILAREQSYPLVMQRIFEDV